MATAIKIVTRAMRLVGVIDAAQAPAADDTQDAIETLNNIGQRWLASGLLTAWTDLTLPTSTLVTPAVADDALAYALAAKIAPEYGKELSPAQQQQSTEEKKLLWRDRLVAVSATARTAGDITLRALRLINGALPNGLPDAVSLPGALVTLNAIGQRWLASGLIAAWTNVAAIGDSVTTPASADTILSANLAVAIAAEYGVALGDDVRAFADVSPLWRDRIATADGTVNGLILRALRIISTHGPLPDSVGFPAALVTLNAMLAEWHVAGIGLPDYSVTGLSDTLASDAADTEAVAYQLAIRLAPEYGSQLSALTMRSAEDAMNRLRLRYFQPGTVDLSELPSPNSYGGRYEFEAGY